MIPIPTPSRYRWSPLPHDVGGRWRSHKSIITSKRRMQEHRQMFHQYEIDRIETSKATPMGQILTLDYDYIYFTST